MGVVEGWRVWVDRGGRMEQRSAYPFLMFVPAEIITAFAHLRYRRLKKKQTNILTTSTIDLHPNYKKCEKMLLTYRKVYLIISIPKAQLEKYLRRKYK